MFSTSGIIYIYEKNADGSRHVIPVEETPDDLEARVAEKVVRDQLPASTEASAGKSVINSTPITTNPQPVRQSPHEVLEKIATTPVVAKPTYPGMRPGMPFGQPRPGGFGARPQMPFGKPNPFAQRPLSPLPPGFKPNFPNQPAAISNQPAPFGLSNPSPPVLNSTYTSGPNRTQAAATGTMQSTTILQPQAPGVGGVSSESEKAVQIETAAPTTSVQAVPSFDIEPITTPIKPPTELAPGVVIPMRPPSSVPQNAPTPGKQSVDASHQDKNEHIRMQNFQHATHTPSGRVNIQPQPHKHASTGGIKKALGISLILISLGGIAMSQFTKLRLEARQKVKEVKDEVTATINPPKELPPAAPVVFNPLVDANGKTIEPVNKDFGIVIPKIGVNAAVIPNVNPSKSQEYNAALDKGVAHASTSSTPDKPGTVYLFSHSTNYEWFVKDLNAIFYLVKNLSAGDYIVIFYNQTRYTYQLKEKRIVKPSAVSYLVSDTEKKSLILQTCWPPGSVAERLLIFADLVEEHSEQI